ncbi:MAG: peptidyl-prolyl cis-trans isomerase [Bryobacterales bacterium]|nr:peptidyl-prolyl cis-trans isomerase [Bryobacterales bacterium]
MNRFSLLLSIAVLLSACSGSKDASAQKAPLSETAPANFRVNFDTSRGPVVVEITRDLAPHGADRLYSLVKAKYFDGARFFRVVPNFMVQWGMAADPAVSRNWDVPIPDDPVKETNARGTISFAATSQPNSRSTQMFINYADNARLDAMGFAPLGKVVSGMDIVDQLYSEDREKPDQMMIKELGNTYLEKEFPHLDYIKTARISQ